MNNNVIVGQSGGPTAVINASLAGVFEAARSRGAQHIYGMRYGVQGLLDGEVVDLRDKLNSSLNVELLKHTPSSYLGSCRYKLPQPALGDEVYEKLFAILDKLEIGYFFYIGGNDSMDTICKLSQYAAMINSPIRFMGIPKTIDNDLAMTDHTPGYGSAAKFIATTMKEIIRDSVVYKLRSVTVVEIMGRNAGWLTGAAALAKGDDCEGADLICLPEVAFDRGAFLARVDKLTKEKGNVVVAVSEGVRLADGKYVCEMDNQAQKLDAFGHKMLTGAASILSGHIRGTLGCKSRSIELNTLQRCAAHMCSEVDQNEAWQAGGDAVEAAYKGHTGEMVCFERTQNHPYQCKTKTMPIGEIANVERTVPAAWITPDGMQVTDEFITYAKPLIQSEPSGIYADGLPQHLRF